MNILRTKSCRWLGLILLASLSGCASAYDSYPCGAIPYGYCPDPPLPYSTYSGCPTPVASSYSPRQVRPATSLPLPAE